MKPGGSSRYAAMFVPKLYTVLREGYSWGDFRADAIAGLTVAIVALRAARGLKRASTPQSLPASWYPRLVDPAYRSADPPLHSSRSYSW